MLHRLVCIYTCQNTTLLEITCRGSYVVFFLHSYRFKNLLNYECWVIFHALLSSAYYFSKSTFLKKIFREHYLAECQTVWIQIRTDILSVLIWIQTVCKGYQRMTKVAAGKKRFKSMCTLDKDQELYIFLSNKIYARPAACNIYFIGIQKNNHFF